nr:hypothetical protein [Tanacetum cinerariifolium]
DDLYNKLRSLEIDVKGGSSYGSRGTVTPTHSAFIGATSTTTKMGYSDQPSHSSSITYTSAHSGSLMEDVDQMDMEELDIKWQMAMLSLQINKFQKKARRNINFNNKDSARLDRRKARCYNCLQLEHFARECNVKKVDEKARYYAFKISEVKTEEPKAMLEHFARECNVKKVDEKARVYDAVAEFSMMGISPKVQTCPFNCDSKLSELKKNYAHLETMYNDSFIQVQAYKNTVKTLELQKDWYHKTQLALEEKAKIEKKEWEVKLLESLASIFEPKPVTRETKSLYERFVKAGDMHEVPPSITGTFMPTSSNSVLEETQILPKSDVKDPSPTNGVSSCSIKENIKPPSDLSSVPAGSRNSSASTSAGRSIPAASRNRSASIHVVDPFLLLAETDQHLFMLVDPFLLLVE